MMTIVTFKVAIMCGTGSHVWYREMCMVSYLFIYLFCNLYSVDETYSFFVQ